MLLRFHGFAGANKALHPLLLPETVGVDSINQRVGRGDLRPVRRPSQVATVPAGRKAIYRMGRDVPADGTYWLSFAQDADVARSFIADDQAERTYWTDGVLPSWTDNTLGLGAAPYPDPPGIRILGVPAPDAAPQVLVAAEGDGEVGTRVFVTVWVNDRGEPSAASNPTTVSAKGGSTFTVNRNGSIPVGSYGLTSWRVYATVPGGGTEFFLAGEASVATGSIAFNGTVNSAAQLDSLTWVMPPAGLRGLKPLWNGIMAGFVGKSLRFCEPFRPYAWPVQYELVLDDTIVALARWGQNLMVLTTGQPYLVTGSHPSAMSNQPTEVNQACVSKLGVVEHGHGISYPSPDGLMYVGGSGWKNLTLGLALRDDWQAMQPSTMVAGEFEGAYVCSYGTGADRRSFTLDPLNPGGFYFYGRAFDACFRDPVQDALYVLDSASGAVSKWDAGAAEVATFVSKTMRTAKATSLGWGQVVADAFPVTLTLWAQGLQRMTNRVVTSGQPFRLPSGFLADEWRLSIDTSNPVQAVMLANTLQELQAA